jgi:hypothetical protein
MQTNETMDLRHSYCLHPGSSSCYEHPLFESDNSKLILSQGLCKKRKDAHGSLTSLFRTLRNRIKMSRVVCQGWIGIKRSAIINNILPAGKGSRKTKITSSTYGSFVVQQNEEEEGLSADRRLKNKRQNSTLANHLQFHTHFDN